jgi:putative ABC transport system permease protein
MGVAGDVRDTGLNQQAPDQIYLAMAQLPNVGSVLVRAAGDPEAVGSAVRRAILDVDPQTAITRFGTLEDFRADSVSAPRTVARLFGAFSALALVIAISGLGCMLALAVRERTREIGIRIALGASPGDVIQSVVSQGAVLTIAGIAAGLVGALLLTRFLSSFLFEVSPTDPLTLFLVPATLLLAALITSYLPARRASRIDPQRALRVE